MAATIKSNSDGNGTFIINACELTAKLVAQKRVLCPLGEDRVFEKWPLGWDGHSAKCRGVFSDTPEERKKEFRRRVRHLFLKR